MAAQGKTPLKNGQPTWCNICQNINHWAAQCPDRNLDEVAMIIHKLVLQNNSDTVLQLLLSETWSSAVLDLVATSIVCGKVWFDGYLKSLASEQKSKITYTWSSKPFRFGNNRQLISGKAATIPATIGSCKVFFLSKAALKKAQIVLNFNNDTIIFQGHQIKLNIISNGLYYLQLLNWSHWSATSPSPVTKIKYHSESQSCWKQHRNCPKITSVFCTSFSRQTFKTIKECRGWVNGQIKSCKMKSKIYPKLPGL